jgi:pimeloyl-ACP methyl ester carboxylesterase
MTARETAGPAPERRFVDVGGLRLHVLVAGPEDGPLLLLLHGFPEGAYGWRHQVVPLARAGYRVWAPDQRGYGRSDKPQGIASYRIDRLAADVLGLIDAAGGARASVVAHDWGGAVAWWLAETAPERLARLVVLNCPHHDVMRRALVTRPRQMLRSWYIALFQLPWLPEALAAARDHALLVRGLRGSSLPGTFGDEELETYREAWRRPGALRAMIHWYRAARLPVPRPARPRAGTRRTIRVPALLLWGARDRALGRELAAPSVALCESGRLVVLEDASHWLQHEQPDRVNALILDGLAESPGDPRAAPPAAAGPS